MKRSILLVLISLPVLCSGCMQINTKRMVYELLAQEDCRRNQPGEFCNRTFANEYHQYERLREDFMRGHTQREITAMR